MAFKQKRFLGHVLDADGELLIVIPNKLGKLFYEEYNASGKSSPDSTFYEIKMAKLKLQAPNKSGKIGDIELDLNSEIEVDKLG